jgi:hypothetical protein
MRSKIISMLFTTCPKTGRVLGPRRFPAALQWLFPLVGLVALIWFLIRVIPKPSRAAYPCQRIAMPLASTFVLWAAGLGGSILAWRHARRQFRNARYALGALCTAGALLALVAVGAGIPMPGSAETGPAPDANNPVGTAKGTNPGRVVWAHDPDATNENCTNTAGDYWWQSTNTDQTKVDSMFARALRELTGATTEAFAWDSVFQYYNRTSGRGDVPYAATESIAVKVNLCSGYGMNHPDYTKTSKEGMPDTSPQMILALLHQLVDIVGVPQEHIFIGDAGRPMSTISTPGAKAAAPMPSPPPIR